MTTREIRERIDAAWAELHTDGVDWNPAVMRLLTAHDEFITAARRQDAERARTEGLTFTSRSESHARELVDRQQAQLKLVTKLPTPVHGGRS